MSEVTKYTSWMAGTLMMILSSVSFVPPKYTGNACASHVTGLNIRGNVRFSSPDSTYKNRPLQVNKCAYEGHGEYEKRGFTGVSYIINYIIQIEDVVFEALVLPTGAGVPVGERLALIGNTGILYEVVEEP